MFPRALLFLIYINDVKYAVQHPEMTVYADDTSFLLRSKDYATLVDLKNEQLDGIGDWFAASRLNLNRDKTKNIIFSLRPLDCRDHQGEANFLGVTLDSKLCFDDHVNLIARKLTSGTFVLRNLAKLVEKEVCMMAYHALIHSVCAYGLLVWGHSAHASRVFALQRRAIRIVARAGYRDEAKPYFQSLKILT